MNLKMLERSDRYLRMFKLTTAMEAKLKEVKRLENEIDILSRVDVYELRDNCDLINFYMDSVEALIYEIKDIAYKMNETVNVSSHETVIKSLNEKYRVNGQVTVGNVQDIMDMDDDGLSGVEMDDDEIDEMVKLLKFNEVKCLSCVEDEHESA